MSYIAYTRCFCADVVWLFLTLEVWNDASQTVLSSSSEITSPGVQSWSGRPFDARQPVCLVARPHTSAGAASGRAGMAPPSEGRAAGPMPVTGATGDCRAAIA